nr:DUF3880 domain-containing protein [Lachnospiraceae bacterium]
MKILLYMWGGLCEDALKNTLSEAGHEVTVLNKKCAHFTRDMKLAGELISLIQSKKIEAVVSFNYIPIISMVCKTTGMSYYSWIYDSPHNTLYAKTITYDCNHIGCFDRHMTQKFNGFGINTIKHLPLGFNKNTFKGVLSDTKYECDVSFVGNLYTGKYAFYDNTRLPDDIRERAEEIIEKQCFDYENDHIGTFFIDEAGGFDEEL